MSFHTKEKLPGIRDEQLLLHTLVCLNYQVETNVEAVQVRGYAREIIATRCRLVIRRETANLGADIGFSQEQDGSFTLVSDRFANKNLDEFGRTLKRTYEQKRAIAQARQLGFTQVQSNTQWIEKNGKKYLQLLISQ